MRQRKNPKDEMLFVIERLIYKVMYQNAYSNVLLKNDEGFDSLAPSAKAFASNVFYGSIENWILLNTIIDSLSGDPKKIKRDLRCLLSAAIYVLRFLDKKSPAVVVNRFVEYAKESKPHAKNFVNFILRNYLRTQIELPQQNTVKDLSIRYSHPISLVEFLKNTYGFEECERILQADNENPVLHARINARHYTMKEVLTVLREDGVYADSNKFSNLAVDIFDLNGQKLEQLRAFQEGAIYVQDLSSILHADLFQIAKNDKILDLCAAPGGKITALMQVCDESNEIIACDIAQRKLNLIESNIRRLGLQDLNYQVMEVDATEFHPKWKEGFEVIVADVPCSGLGVLRHRPEIRYRFNIDEMEELKKVQYQILKNAFKYLKEGGYLVYSTCTINPAENEQQIYKFLENNKNASICSLNLNINGQIHENMIKLVQSNRITDGFFACKLKKGRLENL